jgi:hypothetical protein
MRLRNRSAGAEHPAQARERDRIAGDLERLGVGEGVREELSRRLEALARNLSEDAYDAALAGVALAHAVHREGEDALRKSVRDLQEVQRLLGAFSDEMRKLDDALQILSTYVRRMRSRAQPAERAKILH